MLPGWSTSPVTGESRSAPELEYLSSQRGEQKCSRAGVPLQSEGRAEVLPSWSISPVRGESRSAPELEYLSSQRGEQKCSRVGVPLQSEGRAEVLPSWSTSLVRGESRSAPELEYLSSQRGEQQHHGSMSLFKDINALNWEWNNFCPAHVAVQQRVVDIDVA